MNKYIASIIAGTALAVSVAGCHSHHSHPKLTEEERIKICMDDFKSKDATQFAAKDKDIQARLESGAEFCRFPNGQLIEAYCPVKEDILYYIHNILTRAQESAEEEMKYSITILYGGSTFPWPNFGGYINGLMVADSQMFEEVDAIASAFAYKIKHSDFDIVSYFKKMAWGSKLPDTLPADYDTRLQKKVRRGMLAFMIGHEIAHQAGHDLERWICSDDKDVYGAEMAADKSGVEFLFSAPGNIEKAAMLLFWKYSEITGVYDEIKCATNPDFIDSKNHPCAATRYKFLRNLLNEKGVDTSSIDDIFGIPE